MTSLIEIYGVCGHYYVGSVGGRAARKKCLGGVVSKKLNA